MKYSFKDIATVLAMAVTTGAMSIYLLSVIQVTQDKIIVGGGLSVTTLLLVICSILMIQESKKTAWVFSSRRRR